MSTSGKRHLWNVGMAAAALVPLLWLAFDLARTDPGLLRGGARDRRTARYTWLASPTFDRERYRLEQFGRRVPGTKHIASDPAPHWIDAERFVARELPGYRWVEVNARTGVVTPLAVVTAFWRMPEIEYANYFSVSPDGKWFVASAVKAGKRLWLAVRRDGKSAREWPVQEHDITDSCVAWLPDSRRFIVLGTDSVAVNRYSLSEPVPTRIPVTAADGRPLYSAGYVAPMTITRDGRGFVRGLGQYDADGNVAAYLYEYTFSDKSATVRPRTVTTPELYSPLGISPDGKRHLWGWRPADQGQDGMGFLVSELETGHHYPVLPRMVAGAKSALQGPQNVAWLPDGEHVSLWHDGSLWGVPVRERSPW